MPRWSFTDAPDLAVISLKRIVLDRTSHVLVAIHTSTGWQFLDAADIAEQDAGILGLGEKVQIDPTLVELACLPIGFTASRERRSMNAA